MFVCRFLKKDILRTRLPRRNDMAGVDYFVDMVDENWRGGERKVDTRRRGIVFAGLEDIERGWQLARQDQHSSSVAITDH